MNCERRQLTCTECRLSHRDIDNAALFPRLISPEDAAPLLAREDTNGVSSFCSLAIRTSVCVVFDRTKIDSSSTDDEDTYTTDISLHLL